MITPDSFIQVLSILEKNYPLWNPPVLSFMAEMGESPYRILIATLLSLRTKDEVTTKAVHSLFNKGDTPEKILSIPLPELEKLIYPVGFYKNKAKTIHEISFQIIKDYQGKVPDNLDELLKFKGVGRKTANLVLSLGYKKPAVCVDIHVHRISNRLGIVKTDTPEKTEFALMDKLPEKIYPFINTLLVAFGQTICKPVSPFCSSCPVTSLCEKNGVDKNR
ncbi:MAG TPA: endonuclease III [Spirochaetia bacterium]|nr:MAG: endonuclease III [Spirochaetes bacterium GWB1_36_13]HCL57078.1 endonuclease III [Spirochaetia bacterium]